MSAAAQPTYSTVETFEDLEALAGEWDELVVAMPRPSPFLLHGWLVEWWRAYGVTGKLAVAVARRDGRLVGALPMHIRRVGAARVAQFLGAHESALADALVAPGEGPEVVAGLLAELGRRPYDYCDVFGLPRASLFARAAGARLTEIERVEAPVLLMPNGWEEAYLAKTSSKRRNLHRRRLRQLAETGSVEFVVGRTREELEPLLEDAFRLHHLRWAGRPDGSTFGTVDGQAFHRAALRRLADSGVLRIVLMRVGDRAAAFHYFFELADVMYVHRLAFDPALARYSPGLVATIETLRVAAEDGMRRVEYLGGGERYKLELSDHLEPLYQGLGLARNPLGATGAGLRVAAIQARKTLKRSERLQRLYLQGRLPVGRRTQKDDGDSD